MWGVLMDYGSWTLIILAYISLLTFVVGMMVQIVKWWMAAVPFPLTKFPAATGNGRAFGKMLADTFFFRSLWRRNMEVWISGWGFHLFLFLLITGHIVGIATIGHEFVPFGLNPQQSEQLSANLGLATGIGLSVTVLYLTVRRIIFSNIRAISRFEDFAALGLMILIIISGMMMRLGSPGDLAAVRGFVTGLFTLAPVAAPPHLWFQAHFFLICLLLMWFPFSKLVHGCGIFMTRWLITRVYPRQVVFKND